MMHASVWLMLAGQTIAAQIQAPDPIPLEQAGPPIHVLVDGCETSGARLASHMYLSHGPRQPAANPNHPVSYSSALEVYDFKTKKWRALPNSSLHRYATQSVVLNWQLFVLGGHGAFIGDGHLAQVEAFDPQNGRWQTRASTLEARHRAMAVASEQNIFVFGGEDARGRILRTAESYDAETDRWSPRAPMPRARQGGSAALFRDLVFVFGGVREDGTYVEPIDIYDPKTDRWFVGPASIPEGRWMSSVVATDSYLIVTGGQLRRNNGQQQLSQKILVYEPVAATWSAWPATTSRFGHAAAIFDDQVFLFGGCPHAGDSLDVYVEKISLVSFKTNVPAGPIAKTPDEPLRSETPRGQCPFLDPRTGLCWQNPGSEHPHSWQQAMSYCAQAADGGFRDWRLPSLRELRSLLAGCDDSECENKKGPTAGCYWPQNVRGECSWYHAADEIEGAPSDRHFVYFQSASPQWGAMAIPKYVRCVR